MRKPQCVDPRVNVHKIWWLRGPQSRAESLAADRTGPLKDEGTMGSSQTKQS